jgi:hypothetical protein
MAKNATWSWSALFARTESPHILKLSLENFLTGFCPDLKVDSAVIMPIDTHKFADRLRASYKCKNSIISKLKMWLMPIEC